MTRAALHRQLSCERRYRRHNRHIAIAQLFAASAVVGALIGLALVWGVG